MSVRTMMKRVLLSVGSTEGPTALYATYLNTCIRRNYMTRRCGEEEGGLNKPIPAYDLPRIAGICSMFRLPVQSNTNDLDACFVGVPLDIGTSNRPGTRFGPREIRTESVLIRQKNIDTGAEPFDSIHVADVGDVNFNPYNLPEAVLHIKQAFDKLISNGCKTLTLGGDHTITYPILQSYKEKYGPVGLIHLDAHADVADVVNGATIAHGSPFRRAREEDLLDCSRVIQIGMRGNGYAHDDIAWSMKQGFRVVPARHCWNKSLIPLAEEIREQMGDKPVYLTFDIDALDPAFAPGTGTPEIAGLTTIQALEIIRGCKGLNIVGCDVVEVSPPYDTTGNTSLTAANLLFEMLCVLPGVKHLPVPI